MKYDKSLKYATPELNKRIMGPHPVKVLEELMQQNRTPAGSVVCDLGSGQGLTSLYLAQEGGFTVYAADLWSEPEDNQRFFDEMGVPRDRLIPVKADANDLPFERGFFDAVFSVDSYHYFGRDEAFLDEKLLPFVKAGGYIYIAVPGMKRDLHTNLPQELLLSWTPEDLETMHDADYWRAMVSSCRGARVVDVRQMDSNEEVWADWLKQDNPYAVGDRKSMNAGAGRYLNFVSVILQKKED